MPTVSIGTPFWIQPPPGPHVVSDDVGTGVVALLEKLPLVLVQQPHGGDNPKDARVACARDWIRTVSGPHVVSDDVGTGPVRPLLNSHSTGVPRNDPIGDKVPQQIDVRLYQRGRDLTWARMKKSIPRLLQLLWEGRPDDHPRDDLQFGMWEGVMSPTPSTSNIEWVQWYAPFMDETENSRGRSIVSIIAAAIMARVENNYDRNYSLPITTQRNDYHGVVRHMA